MHRTWDRAQRRSVVLTAMALVAAACGGSSDTATASTTAAPVVTTAVPPSTAASTTATTSTTSATTTTTTSSTTTTSTTVAPATALVLSELPQGDVASGEAVFNARNPKVRFGDSCATCHSPDGESRRWGPVLDGLGAAAGERIDGLSAEEYLFQSIIDPKAFLYNDWPANMPTNYRAALTEQEIADLLAYMAEI